jgi:hypothetical protein
MKDAKDYDKFLSSILDTAGMKHWYTVNDMDFAFMEPGFYFWEHTLKINGHLIGIREKKKLLGILPYTSEKIIARVDSEPELVKDLHENEKIQYCLAYNGLELTLFDLGSKEKIKNVADQLEKKFEAPVKIKIKEN